MLQRVLLLALLLPIAVFADLEWKHKEITHNAKPEDESVTALFHFANTSDHAIEILSMKSSCGCTVPELEKTRYEPGEVGTIRAKFTFEGRTGFQEKKIQVTVDDKANPIYVLTLRVNIPLFISVEPQLIFWNRDEDLTPKTAIITVLDKDPVDIVSVTCEDPTFTVEKTVVEAGRSYIITVIPSSTAKAAQTKVTLTTNIGTENPRKAFLILQVY